MENQIRGHFLTYTINPIKICVLIMELMIKMISGHNSFVIKNVYLEIIEQICNSYGGQHHLIKLSLLDTTYKNKVVLDVISENGFYEIFQIPQISLFVNQIWKGEYQDSMICQYSLNMRIVTGVVSGENTKTGFIEDYANQITFREIYSRFKQNDVDKDPQGKPILGHNLMFKVWKKSIKIRYYLDSLWLVALTIFLQLYLVDFLESSLSWYEAYPNYTAAKGKYSSLSSTDSGYSTAKADYEKQEGIIKSLGDNGHAQLKSMFVIQGILCASFFKNLMHILFAKIRGRKPIFAYRDTFLSFIQTVIFVFSLARYIIKSLIRNPIIFSEKWVPS